MTKNQYIARVRNRILFTRSRNEICSVLNDLENLFVQSEDNGIDEDDFCHKLGNPSSYVKNYKETHKSKNIYAFYHVMLIMIAVFIYKEIFMMISWTIANTVLLCFCVVGMMRLPGIRLKGKIEQKHSSTILWSLVLTSILVGYEQMLSITMTDSFSAEYLKKTVYIIMIAIFFLTFFLIYLAIRLFDGNSHLFSTICIVLGAILSSFSFVAYAYNFLEKDERYLFIAGPYLASIFFVSVIWMRGGALVRH